MEQLLKIIKRDKIPCIFISPHLDDAILSSGELIARLSEMTNVSVISVFTQGGKTPYSFSAQAYLRQCHASNVTQLYSQRRKEDKNALQSLNVTCIHLDYIDALWRKKKMKSKFMKRASGIFAEIEYVYPTYRFHVLKGKIAQHDAKMIDSIANNLKKLVSKQKNALVFAPLGLGSHVDHVIVSELCEQLFTRVLYWSDFPYNMQANSRERMKKKKYRFKVTQRKEALINLYTSQVQPMFTGGKIPLVDEYYYEHV